MFIREIRKLDAAYSKALRGYFVPRVHVEKKESLNETSAMCSIVTFSARQVHIFRRWILDFHIFCGCIWICAACTETFWGRVTMWRQLILGLSNAIHRYLKVWNVVTKFFERSCGSIWFLIANLCLFLFSNFRNGRLLYIRPVDWLVGRRHH